MANALDFIRKKAEEQRKQSTATVASPSTPSAMDIITRKSQEQRDKPKQEKIAARAPMSSTDRKLTTQEPKAQLFKEEDATAWYKDTQKRTKKSDKELKNRYFEIEGKYAQANSPLFSNDAELESARAAYDKEITQLDDEQIRLDKYKYKIDSRLKTSEYTDKYADKTRDYSEWGQAQANFDVGRLMQDRNMAWNAYLEYKTPENLEHAKALDSLAKDYQEKNADLLGRKSAIPILTETYANYLPQQMDQLGAQIAGGAIGGAAGAGLGNPKAGMKAGAVIATGIYSYSNMRGAAFANLLELGIDEELAERVANDEAVISAMIEMADTAVDIATLGWGKLATLVTKGAVKPAAASAIKTFAKTLFKYGINIIGEGVEEELQEAVSIASERRAMRDDSPDFWGHVGDAAQVRWDAFTGNDPESKERIAEVGKMGRQIALIGGGTSIAFTSATGKVATVAMSNAKEIGAQVRAAGQEGIDVFIQAGLDSDGFTDAYILADKLDRKIAAGEVLSDTEIGRLVELVTNDEKARQQAEIETRQKQEKQAQFKYNVSQFLSTDNEMETATPVRRAADATFTPGGSKDTTPSPATQKKPSAVGQKRVTDAATLQEAAAIIKEVSKINDPVALAEKIGIQGSMAVERLASERRTNPDGFVPAFAMYYQAGMIAENAKFDAIQDQFGTDISANAQRIAYEAGRADAVTVKEAAYFGKNSGLVKDISFYRARVDMQTASRLDALAKITGMQIRFRDQIKDKKGRLANASIENGVMYIARDSSDPFIVAAIHESVHRIRQTDPEAYNAINNAVWDIAEATNVEPVKAKIKQLQELYGVKSRDFAKEEFTAQALGVVMQDGKVLDQFVQNNPSVVRRFVNAIRELIKKVRDYITKNPNKLSKDQMRGYVNLVADASKIEEVYSAALERQNMRAEEAEAYTLGENAKRAESADVPIKYSLKTPYGDMIDKISTMSDDEALSIHSKTPYIKILDSTPKILVGAGASDLTILIRFDAAYLAQRESGAFEGHYHNLGAETMSNLPRYLSHPDVVLSTMNEKTGKERLVVLTRIESKNGQGLASVEINTVKDIDSTYEYYNIVVTFFDVKQRYFNTLFNKYNAKVKYENEALAQVNPQLHEWLGIVNALASDNSIPNLGEDVNEKYSLRSDGETAAYRKETLDKLYSYFSVKEGSSHLDYAQRYVTYISPDDFLSLTATDASRERIEGVARADMGSLEADKVFGIDGSPYLEFNIDTGEIEGHEGRHRMVLFKDSGIKTVPIVMQPTPGERGKYDRKKIANLRVIGQEFRTDKAPGKTILNEVIPLSLRYKAEVYQKFTDTDADARYSLRYEGMLDKYGAMPKGETPARDVQVPLQSGPDKYVSQFARNAMEAASTPDEDIAEIMDQVAAGVYSHERKSNNVSFERAENLYLTSPELAEDRWKAFINGTEVFRNPDDVIALGQYLLAKAGQEKNAERVKSLIAEISAEATRAGRAVQIFRLLKRIGGAGQLYYIERVVQNLQKDIDAKRKPGDTREVARIRRDIADMQTQLDEVDLNLFNAQEQVDAIEKLQAAVESEKSVRAAETAAQREIADVERQIRNTKARTRNANKRSSKLDAEIKSLQAKLDEARKKYEAAKKRRDDAVAERSRLTDALSKTLEKTDRAVKREYSEWWNSQLLIQELGKAREELTKAQDAVDKTKNKRRRMADLKSQLQEYGELDIPQELRDALAQTDDPAKIEKIADMIYTAVADQLKASWADKWNAWRYLSMLGNPRTHIRNVVGNAVFAPVVMVKNIAGAMIESLWDTTSKATGREGIRRTKTVAGALPFTGGEARQFAITDFDNVRDIITGGGKMNPSDIIRDRQRIFKNTALEWARRTNFNLLELEDALFLKGHFVRAMTQYITSNKLDTATLTEGSKQLEQARLYAIQEAQKATYRDASAVATSLAKFARDKKVGFVVEALMPFKKTPINLIKRGVEYSPIGLINAVTRGRRDLVRDSKSEDAEISANAANIFIDKLSSGLTGTGVWLLGGWLASLGMLTGGGGDEDEDRFLRNAGQQSYALQIGDRSYTLDWMAPISMPLFVGVELWRLWSDDGSFTMASFADALAAITEPMYNMSMLQGINDLIRSVRYGDVPLTDAAIQVVAGYFGQAVPALGGQIARTIDDERRTTYRDKDSLVPPFLQPILQRNINKIPGLNMIDAVASPAYRDAWGRPADTGTGLSRAVQNFLSPGYTSRTDLSPMEQELLRLYRSTGESVLISKPQKYFMSGGGRIDLNADQYQRYTEVRGQTAYTLASRLVNSPEYMAMKDAERAVAVQKIYEYSTAVGKMSISNYSPGGWVEKSIRGQEYGVTTLDYILFEMGKVRANSDGSLTQEEVVAAINALNLDNQARNFLFSSQYQSDKNNPYGGGINSQTPVTSTTSGRSSFSRIPRRFSSR